MRFSEQLYKYRTEAKMTQEELAEKCDVTRQAVAKWERGESVPDIYKIIQISEIFAISLDELVRGQKGGEMQEDVAKKIYFLFVQPNVSGVDLLEDKEHIAVFTPKNIIEAIRSQYGISEEALNWKIYKKQRDIMIHLLNYYAHFSIADISREMGIKDYTKVLHRTKKFQELLSMDKDLKEEVNTIIDVLFQMNKVK